MSLETLKGSESGRSGGLEAARGIPFRAAGAALARKLQPLALLLLLLPPPTAAAQSRGRSRHPENGQEFALGCGLCRNLQSF